MFQVWVQSLVSVAFVSALSLMGILTFMLERELHRGLLLYLVSLSVGGLFGGAFFHLIPEAVEASGFTPRVSVYILIGILTSFIVEQCLKWRHCHVLTSEEHHHTFGYMNLFGDAVHNMIDGMIIGGSYLVSSSMGLATTLAVCFHELPQEIGDFGILLYAGFRKRTALLYNFLTALTAFIGAVVALALSVHIENLVMFLVPFTAGNFIYIAGSDLIPELHAEEKLNRIIVQLAAMVLGMMLLFSIKKVG
jgi:zinc and cadmium transporter